MNGKFLSVAFPSITIAKSGQTVVKCPAMDFDFGAIPGRLFSPDFSPPGYPAVRWLFLRAPREARLRNVHSTKKSKG
jgi:hypothetical protein